MAKKLHSDIKNLQPAVQPISLAEVREIALNAAGFDPEAVGQFVRQGVAKLIQKLEAKTVKHFAFEGRIADVAEYEDNAAQISAAKALVDIGADVTAMRRKAGEEKPKTAAKTEINLVGWNVTIAEKMNDAPSE